MGNGDLLQQALNRHALQSSSAGGGDETSNQATAAAAGGLGTVALHALTLSDDDNEEIEVRTPGGSTPVSTTSTPSGSRAGSRSSSPSGQGKRRGGGAGKPRRDKSKELAKAEQNKNPLDPINRFPGEVNGRIFGELGVDELLACGLVSKRWRRSQTLNYTWYLLLQSLTYVSPAERKSSYSQTKGLPTWLKSEAKEDWAARFANIYRRDDLDERDLSRDENGLTLKEERELKWAEENEAQEALGLDKVQMRQYYKSLGNSKIKGKKGKGGERTWEGSAIETLAPDDGI